MMAEECTIVDALVKMHSRYEDNKHVIQLQTGDEFEEIAVD